MDYIAAGIIAGVTLIATWFAAYLGALFAERGKNTATKEDIGDITKRIEEVKIQFSQKHHRSSLYLDRQLIAYEAIAEEIYKLVHWHFTDLSTLPLNEVPSKLNQFCSRIVATYEKHEIFMSRKVLNMIAELVRRLGALNPTGTNASDSEWVAILDAASDVRDLIRDELMEG